MQAASQVIAFALVLAACSYEAGIPPCSGGRIVEVQTNHRPDGIVTTSGACDAATCMEPLATGCVAWYAMLTGNDPGDLCTVTLTLPDRPALARQVSASPVCADPQNVSFDE